MCKMLQSQLNCIGSPVTPVARSSSLVQLPARLQGCLAERMVAERRNMHLRASSSDCASPSMGKDKGKGVKAKATAVVRETADTLSWVAAMPVVKSHAAVRPSKLTDGQSSFVEEHRIRGGEVGPDRQATLVTVSNLLQEAAGNHVVALWGRTDEGFGTCPEMAENNQIFVVTRLQIQMDTYPMWGDVVQLETWFQSDTRLSANREWTLKDATTGKVFGKATSTWVVINTKTRRLSKVPSSMQLVMEKFQPEPRKYGVLQEESKQKIPDVQEPFDIEGPVQVARRSDMDMNGHINNVTYLAWTLETVPKEVYNNGKLAQIEVDYKHECQAGDTVESGAMQVPENEVTYTAGGQKVAQFVHILRRCDGKKCTELVRARTTWVLP